MLKPNPLFILIAGPYRSNTGDDPGKIEQNLRTMAQAGLDVFRLGHLPVLGESLALPLIAEAGSRQIGDAVFNEIFHPISRLLARRVDAVLRVGGPSKGADEMVEIARSMGRLVFRDVSQIPPLKADAQKEAK